jgi:hypothetical protein
MPHVFAIILILGIVNDQANYKQIDCRRKRRQIPFMCNLVITGNVI